jgi:hypothetical protein
VFNDTGKLLSDVGGPYVIAPVKGVISLNGVAVGRFVMSVQDDVGYTKLETRTIGDPIGIYVKGKLAVETSQGKRVVVELGGNFPSNEPSGKSLVLAGVRYHVLTRTYRSFPDSHLQAVIAIPLPTAEMKAQSCDAVRVSELERLTNTLSIQFPPLTQHFHEFVGISGIFIGVHLIVREGATVLATNIGPGPTSLPSRGRVTYRGVNWFVVSSSPSPGVRIYLLAPTNSNAIAGASGATGAVGSTRSTGTAGAAGPQV